MIVAGLDLSINSSGITIRTENDEYKYIIVTSKMTKNLKSNTNKKLKIIEYNKTDDKDNNIYNSWFVHMFVDFAVMTIGYINM